MSLMSKHQVVLNASLYKSAVAGISRAAAIPFRSAADLKIAADIIQANKLHFRYARARRIEILINDVAFRQFVQKQGGGMTAAARREWLTALRRQPARVLVLPAARQFLVTLQQAQAQDLRTLVALVAGVKAVTEAVLAYCARTQRGVLERDRRSVQDGLAQVEARIRWAEDKLEALRAGEGSEAQAQSEWAADLVAAIVHIIGDLLPEPGDPPSAPEAPEELQNPPASGAEQCLTDAERRRNDCRARCAAGPAGDVCRAACEAAYLLDCTVCVTT